MILHEVAQYIKTKSTGFVRGTNLFCGFMPDSPATCSALYVYAGSPSEHVMGSTALAYETPRLQVVCRSSASVTAYRNAYTIYKYLDAVGSTGSPTLKPSTSATGCVYHKIDALQSPFMMGRDSNGYFLYGCNYEIWKDLST
jgi:hypothetical protein